MVDEDTHDQVVSTAVSIIGFSREAVYNVDSACFPCIIVLFYHLCFLMLIVLFICGIWL